MIIAVYINIPLIIMLLLIFMLDKVIGVSFMKYQRILQCWKLPRNTKLSEI